MSSTDAKGEQEAQTTTSEPRTAADTSTTAEVQMEPVAESAPINVASEATQNEETNHDPKENGENSTEPEENGENAKENTEKEQEVDDLDFEVAAAHRLREDEDPFFGMEHQPAVYPEGLKDRIELIRKMRPKVRDPIWNKMNEVEVDVMLKALELLEREYIGKIRRRDKKSKRRRDNRESTANRPTTSIRRGFRNGRSGRGAKKN